LQPDGKVLAGFDPADTSNTLAVARYLTDGALDGSFAPAGIFKPGGMVNVIVVQPDGKIIAGGDFRSINSTGYHRIVRLNGDGSIDNTFAEGAGFDSTVTDIRRQPDGKLLVAGYFTSYNGTARNRIARLNSDGSLDHNFDVGTGFNELVQTIALQQDGKVLAGGMFTGYNGTGRNRIARLLNSDWTVVKSRGNTFGPAFITYPNPSDGNFTVVFNDIYPQPITVEIFNGQGRLVKSVYAVTENKVSIDLGRFAKGAYLIRVKTNEKVIGSDVIIVN
jgi:uncharacterized delta-60 repeat protein